MSIISALFGSSNTSHQPPVDPDFYYQIATVILPSGIFGQWSLDTPKSIIDRLSTPIAWKQMMADIIFRTVRLYRTHKGGLKKELLGPDSIWLDNFKPSFGAFSDLLRYVVIAYPTPPPFSWNNGTPVLAPHFSGIVYTVPEYKVNYFVLRQSSTPNTSSQTILREFLADGTNNNLGPGGVADYAVFLAWIKQRTETGGAIYGSVK